MMLTAGSSTILYQVSMNLAASNRLTITMEHIVYFLLYKNTRAMQLLANVLNEALFFPSVFIYYFFSEIFGDLFFHLSPPPSCTCWLLFSFLPTKSQGNCHSARCQTHFQGQRKEKEVPPTISVPFIIKVKAFCKTTSGHVSLAIAGSHDHQ